MIPKTIHYCWFGGNQKPEIIERCIESWRKYCPDWEIKEWNESNYDVNAHPYTKEAYEAKKWAFVSDVARLDIVCKEGGVYMDTDVELLAPLDFTVDCDAFYAFETNLYIASGLGFGAVAGHPSVKAMLKYYDGRHFLVKGKQDMSPCPAKNTEALAAIYPQFNKNGEHQSFENVVILSGNDYAQIAKHYSTGLWGEKMAAGEKKRVFRDTKFKRIIRTPKLIDWIEKHLGKKAAKVYIFIVYDLMEQGLIYFLKRFLKKLFGKG